MDEKRILEILNDAGVLLEGHFLLTSGRHSHRYMQCAKVFEHPSYTEELALALAKSFEGIPIDLVIGPAIGGIILSYEVARQLGVKNVFAEREEGIMTLRRGFNIPKGSKVLVVEDVITTGGSVKEVVKMVEDLGSQVVGIGVLVDRSGGQAEFGVNYKPLIAMDIISYKAEDCSLCKAGIPIKKPGSRVV